MGHAGDSRVGEPPLGLISSNAPSDNPQSAAKVALGKRLFFDKVLSRDGSVACATCHDPGQAFADRGRATSSGVEGREGRRNSPSLLNVAFASSLFHDGRVASLEEQAWQPILAEEEMGNHSKAEVLDHLRASPEYPKLFEAAFGVAAPDEGAVAKALASFQRTLLSGDSAFDRWFWGGDVAALSGAAERGYQLFAGRAQCWQCHPVGGDAVLFTDGQFHNTGVAHRSVQAGGGDREQDLGRFEVSKRPQDRGAFKTPSLRNVAMTPPYMHDGSFETLREVVEFYNRGGADHELVSPIMGELYLSDAEIDDLVAFLESLTSGEYRE